MPNVFQKADQAPMYAVAARLKVDIPNVDYPVQIVCPLHDDHAPSARFYPDSNSCFCWTCNRAFGPVALVAGREQVSFTRAAHLIGEWFGIDLSPSLEEAEAERLIAAWEDPPALGDPNDRRRAAAMILRPVGMPWPLAETLMNAYEVLDLTLIDPMEWVRWAQGLEVSVDASS
jgi:hypothetical protein